jgi:phosphate transport system substrate-binding protein
LLSVLSIQAATAQNLQKVQIVGVGTTAPLPLYSKWFQIFEKAHPEIHFSYMPSGSQSGIEMVTSGAADFGATDIPMSGKELETAKVAEFATLLIAIAPVYNLPGVSRPLRFTPRALAGIYLGTITKWNDPLISAVNPDEHLPASRIVVIHSSDGRGSTYVWSDYLSKVSPEWRTRVGRGMKIAWPVGEEANGNGNVAKMVKDTLNSIGFVEVAHALQDGLPCGRVQNSAGNFVGADFSSVEAAAEIAKASSNDFHSSITNPAADNAYPISSFSWILISEHAAEASKHAAVKSFLRWALDEGQSYAAPSGFTQLPKKIAEQELNAIDRMP